MNHIESKKCITEIESHLRTRIQQWILTEYQNKLFNEFCP